jgi:uncharacterized membrane protein YjjP (DUF1212 family)
MVREELDQIYSKKGTINFNSILIQKFSFVALQVLFFSILYIKPTAIVQAPIT